MLCAPAASPRQRFIWSRRRQCLLVLDSEGHIKSRWLDSSLVTSVFSKGKVIWSSLTVVTQRAKPRILKATGQEQLPFIFQFTRWEKWIWHTCAPYSTKEERKKSLPRNMHLRPVKDHKITNILRQQSFWMLPSVHFLLVTVWSKLDVMGRCCHFLSFHVKNKNHFFPQRFLQLCLKCFKGFKKKIIIITTCRCALIWRWCDPPSLPP